MPTVEGRGDAAVRDHESVRFKEAAGFCLSHRYPACTACWGTSIWVALTNYEQPLWLTTGYWGAGTVLFIHTHTPKKRNLIVPVSVGHCLRFFSSSAKWIYLISHRRPPPTDHTDAVTASASTDGTFLVRPHSKGHVLTVIFKGKVIRFPLCQ